MIARRIAVRNHDLKRQKSLALQAVPLNLLDGNESSFHNEEEKQQALLGRL